MLQTPAFLTLPANNGFEFKMSLHLSDTTREWKEKDPINLNN